MAVKVDLAKAYDCLSWTFLQDTLQKTGIPSRLIDIIVQLSKSGDTTILWNGRKTEAL